MQRCSDAAAAMQRQGVDGMGCGQRTRGLHGDSGETPAMLGAATWDDSHHASRHASISRLGGSSVWGEAASGGKQHRQTSVSCK